MLPAVFLRLCAHFHQDVDLLYRDGAEAVAAFVAREPDDEVQRLLAFLRTDLLQRAPERVQATWETCVSDLMPEDATAFLAAVAEAADAAMRERLR